MTKAEYAQVAQMIEATAKFLSRPKPYALVQFDPAQVQDGGHAFLARIRYEGGYVARCAECGALVGVSGDDAAQSMSDDYAFCETHGRCKVTVAHETVER